MSPLPWHPEKHVDCEEHLGATSLAFFEHLRRTTSAARRSFALDPREAHRQLFAALAPPDHPEYSGTYRGTVGTSLEDRFVALASHTGRPPQHLQSPGRVLSDIDGFYSRWVNEYFDTVSTMPIDAALRSAARLFYGFGRIHPFLDGNGHIQRLLFAACVFERDDLTLLPSWTVHPRPYGLEFAEALEGRNANESLVLLTEMLSKYVKTRL